MSASRARRARLSSTLTNLSSVATRGARRARLSSTLTDLTSRLLREGDTKAMPGSIPGPPLPTLEELTAALPPQPVSMPMLKAAARNRSVAGRIGQARFLRRELISRRAHILQQLHRMPEPLANQPAVGQLAGVYWQRLRDLLTEPEPTTDAEERAFFLRSQQYNDQIAAIGSAAEEQMCMDALGAMQRERGSAWWATHPAERLAVDRKLDAIFLARIGLRFLLEHFVACDRPRDGFAGALHLQCSPVAACEAAAARTEAAVAREHGSAPRVEVVGDSSKTFLFVPSHIDFVLGQLLYNSSVATVRHHHRRQQAGSLAQGAPLPPVRVVVAVSDEIVQIKLADEAGGIRRSSLINVWSYRALESSWWSPRDGLSLPLARLYCKYWGGSLALVPMEGFGTDCYVTLNRLAHENAETIIPAAAAEAEDSLATRPRAREGGAVGLFDAQSRRHRELPGGRRGGVDAA